MNMNRLNSLHFNAKEDRLVNSGSISRNTKKNRKWPTTDRSEANSTPLKKHKTEPSTINRYSASNRGKNPERDISVVPPGAVEERCAAHLALQQMPEEILLNIFSRLNLRDIVVIKSTFEAADRVVNDILGTESKRWFSRFSPQQQATFKKIAEGTDEQVLCTWLGQFTKEDKVVKHLRDNRHHCHYPELLFYTVSRLMADCQAFKVDQIASIEHTGRVEQTTFSDDGNHMVTQSVRGQSKIYALSPAGNWVEKTTICHDENLSSTKFSGDGKHVVSKSINGQSKIYALNSDGNWIVESKLPQGISIEFAEFSPDGLRVAIIVNTKTLKIFSRGMDGAWAEEDNFSDGVYAHPSFNRSGNELIVLVNDQLDIYRRDSDGAWDKKDPLVNHAMTWVEQVSPNDRHMIIIDILANTSKIYSRGTNDEWMEKAVIGHKEWVSSADFSPNSRYVVTSSQDNTHAIYHLATNGSWIKKAIIDGNTSFIPATFSFDGRYFAITNDDRVKLYVLGAEGQCTETTRIDRATHALFSSDSNHIITFHDKNPDGNVRLYGLSQDGTLKLKATFDHGKPVRSATISPTGRYLVTNGDDAKAKIWLLCCSTENEPGSREMVQE